VRQVELESLMKRYAEQQEEIARTEDLIRRFRYKASKAAMVQERVRKLEKLDSEGLRIEIPESLKKISISFPPPPHAGRIALTLEGIGRRYGERRVLAGLDLVLESGERLVVVGRNGAGKSTLLRIIAAQDAEHEGLVRYGAGVMPGYFSQDSAEAAYFNGDGALETTVLDFMEAEAPTALIPRLRDMLGAFLFRGDDVYKSLSVLSGGERSRLALLRMLLKPMNLLILDEPTNHLDLHSKDILLDALKAYAGTIIFVSHDRAFMEALSTKTLELSPQGHRLFYGGYGYYLDRAAQAQEEVSVEKPPLVEQRGQSSLDRGAQKQRQALIRRLERQEAEIIASLGALEAEKAGLEAELSRPAVYSKEGKAREVSTRLKELALRIEALSKVWEERATELASAKGQLPLC
jgi:ATP-binding cassette subfamily F protein 3